MDRLILTESAGNSIRISQMKIIKIVGLHDMNYKRKM